ncbi:hypothetical protein IQ273_10015 [Nodosilinea sp. LEGE 07298]|uniref:hypothetical protein n=1 Tax=Nodosilinea sp. LEGE 07298 TaxID=2777970 RepID=UPI001880E7DD|nr:hypothetical protein [Nodosilinea sp. LEGE 07298]MBE9109748.1 hypothetical protein [Nodosilinea sp. LEGE 07298]
MPTSDEWLGSALAYRSTVYEYCQLALRPSLDRAAAERMGEILQRAEAEPLLNLLIDEADRLVARLQPCLCEQHLYQQQQRLRGAIDALWVNELLATAGSR